MKQSGIQIIADERKEQLELHQWNAAHDDRYENGELWRAALCYVSLIDRKPFIDGKSEPPASWPWSWKWWKPSPRDRIKELAKAGALIAAEIERIQREESANT